jgi:integrase/recombinase XerD
MTNLRMKMMQDMQIRNYSPRTIETYVEHIARFARHFNKSPDLLGVDEIRAYQLLLVVKRKRSPALLKQFVCAARFLYTVTLHRKIDIKFIPHPRRQRRIPVVLSREETSALLRAVRSPKLRMALMLAYAVGLRVSEIVHLKVTDIDTARMILAIREGKGLKDRMVPLSPKLLERLRQYWKEYRPKTWLFPGDTKTGLMSVSAMQKACKRARRIAGLRKAATPHTLRHSCATHLMEAGTNSRIIQRLLGHGSLQMTERYTHVTGHTLARVQDLLDELPEVK